MRFTVIISRKTKMHVSYRHIFKTLCFYSYSKLNLVNFEQPKKHIYLEKFIFTFLWLLSALGKFKHLVTLAKVFTILLLSKCSSQWPMVFRYTSFCWLKKRAKLQVTLLSSFVQALVSMHSCAIIRLPCFILKVLPRFPAGCQLLASAKSLKAVHLFRD